MKKVIVILALTLLSGCSTVKTWVPSFWDDNQSARIVDVQMSVHALDCAKPHLAQALAIQHHLTWFELYSASKGWRQDDVLRLIAPMQSTVKDFVERSSGDKQGSRVYCDLKKQLLTQQSKRAAQAVLGRF